AWGIRAVIAPSLGDIFRQNCVKNGLLPVILPAATVALAADRDHLGRYHTRHRASPEPFGAPRPQRQAEP
ncbi:MAG: hypothetical protein K6T74_07700, partial [Geminicoccaceae bacterium]|nr:hypothetical protein [Geminicoccaceae bacterium]